jgi:hypothetical protein
MPTVSQYNLDVDKESQHDRQVAEPKHKASLSSATVYSELVRVIASEIKKQGKGSASSQMRVMNGAAFPKSQRCPPNLNDKSRFINRYVQSKQPLKSQN